MYWDCQEAVLAGLIAPSQKASTSAALFEAGTAMEREKKTLKIFFKNYFYFITLWPDLHDERLQRVGGALEGGPHQTEIGRVGGAGIVVLERN